MPNATRSATASRRTLVAAVLGILLLLPAPAAGAMSEGAFEQCLVDAINGERRAAGLAEVTLAHDLVPAVRSHSAQMATGTLTHMTTAEREAILPPGTSVWRENIAHMGDSSPEDCTIIHEALMDSPGHRANILTADVRFIAPGVQFATSGTWVTELFFDATGYSPGWEGIFWDDDGSIFEADIEKLAAAGITSGCDVGMFCPADSVTRGQMAAFLVRALDLPAAGSAGFVDTPGSAFEADIDALAAAGITSGCDVGVFCPNEPVTRGQMAAFLVRALDLPAAGSAGFVDTSGSAFEADIDALAAAGITSGCEVASFCPSQPVTRGQMAAFLVRAFGL